MSPTPLSSDGIIRPARQRAAWVLAASLCAAVLTARLGFWQLHRAAEKMQLQTDIAARAAQPVLAASDLAADPATALDQHYRRIVLRGRWLAGETSFLDNRQMAARQGFYVLTPLQIANTRQAIVVQRGWVPRDQRDRSLLPALDTPAGEVEVTGRLAPQPGRLFEPPSWLSGPAAPDAGPIRQNLDLAALEKRLTDNAGLRLMPMSVQQADDAATAGDGLMRQWPPPGIDVARHQGYAFQWFALCALITGLYVWFQLLRPRLRRSAR